MNNNTQVDKISLSLIKPYWRNARNIDDAVPVVKESIRLFGYIEYIVVDKNLTIVAGHARYKALVELGYTEISVIVADLPEDKIRAYRIADNKTAGRAVWITDDLITEIKTLPNLEEVGKFFNPGELDNLLKGVLSAPLPPVSTADIDKQNNINQHVFENANRQELEEYLEVVCPDCGKSFNVKREDILTRRY